MVITSTNLIEPEPSMLHIKFQDLPFSFKKTFKGFTMFQTMSFENVDNASNRSLSIL